MQITRFSSSKDAGYVAVSGQLWLWVDALQKQAEAHRKATAPEAPIPIEELRDRRTNRFETTQETGGFLYPGSTISGGGPVFNGNQNVGRDFNLSMDRR